MADEQTDAPPLPATPDSKDTAGRPDRRLLELLVCPLTKTRLEYDEQRNELISRAAQLAYPIRAGVPLMTAEAARALTDEDRPNR